MTDWRETTRDSYPFLHIARRRCMPYSSVICLAACEMGLPFNHPPIVACGVMDLMEIQHAVRIEKAWQERVAAEEAEKLKATEGDSSSGGG